MKKKHTTRKYMSAGKNVPGQTGKCQLCGKKKHLLLQSSIRTTLFCHNLDGQKLHLFRDKIQELTGTVMYGSHGKIE